MVATVVVIGAMMVAPGSAAPRNLDLPDARSGLPEPLVETIQTVNAGVSRARADTVETSRLLVKVDESAAPSQQDAAFSSLAATSVEALGGGWSRVEVAETTTADSAEVAATGAVVDIEPDLPVWKNDAAPNDPFYQDGSMWGLTGGWGINPQGAWNSTTGSDSVTVAVLDTGIDYGHSDLANRVWRNWDETPGNGVDDDGDGFVDDVYGWDFLHEDASVYDPGDGDAHGTHVAGTIAAQANNSSGVAGVNWNVKFMPLKFIGPSGGYTSDAIQAMNYAVAHGASVINASWGGSTYSAALKSAIDNAGNAGVLVVAAAGNEGIDSDVSPHYPSAYDSWNVISVMSINSAGSRSSYSNYGRWTVDIGAPGERILSTVPGNAYQYYSGTSMAAPHVSGVAALFKALNPGAGWATMKDAILYRAKWDPAIGNQNVTSGVVDASNAVYSLPSWKMSTLDAGTSTGAAATGIGYGSTVYVFDKDVNGRLRAGRIAGGSWNFSNPGPTTCKGNSIAAVNYFGWLHVFSDADVSGTPALCHLVTKDGVTWYSQILDNGNSTGKGLSATQYGMQLHVFTYGIDSGSGTPLRHSVYDTVGGWASHDLGIDDPAADSKTSTVSFAGELHVFDPQTDNKLKHYVWAPSLGRWLTEVVTSDVVPGSAMSVFPTNLGELHIMYGGTPNKLQHRYYNPWARAWTTETLQTDVASGGDITTTTYGGAFRVVYGATGTRLGLRTYYAGQWYQEYLDAGTSKGTDGLSAVLYANQLRIYANGTGSTLRQTYWG